MNFLEWSIEEKIRTPLAPSPTSHHTYDLPILTHMQYLGGNRLSDDDFNERTQFLELAYNRGREIGIHETKKEYENGTNQKT